MQVDFVDVPDNLVIEGAVGTDRVPADWQLSVAEQENGAGRLLGFSFSGAVIETGSGAVFGKFSASAGEPTDVTLCTSGETLSDESSAAYLVESACSSTMIDVEGIHISFSDFSGPLDQGESDMMSVYMSNPYDVWF